MSLWSVVMSVTCNPFDLRAHDNKMVWKINNRPFVKSHALFKAWSKLGSLIINKKRASVERLVIMVVVSKLLFHPSTLVLWSRKDWTPQKESSHRRPYFHQWNKSRSKLVTMRYQSEKKQELTQRRKRLQYSENTWAFFYLLRRSDVVEPLEFIFQVCTFI